MMKPQKLVLKSQYAGADPEPVFTHIAFRLFFVSPYDVKSIIFIKYFFVNSLMFYTCSLLHPGFVYSNVSDIKYITRWCNFTNNIFNNVII